MAARVSTTFLERAFHKAGLVGVLDAQQKPAALLTGNKLVVQRGAQTAQVQQARGTGRKAYANFLRHIHSRIVDFPPQNGRYPALSNKTWHPLSAMRATWVKTKSICRLCGQCTRVTPQKKMTGIYHCAILMPIGTGGETHVHRANIIEPPEVASAPADPISLRLPVAASAPADPMNLRLLVLDCDGVLTDGGIIYNNQRIESKHFSARDGLGVRLLSLWAYSRPWLTGRTSELLAQRCADLRITRLLQHVNDKRAA
jgi:hypothetical protein